MPRKKQNMKRILKDVADEEMLDTPQIKVEPVDDYGQEFENSEFISVEIKSEPVDDEYLSNGFEENSSESNQQMMESSAMDSSIDENEVAVPMDEETSDHENEETGEITTKKSVRNSKNKHWYDQYEQYTVDELITMFGRNDRPYRNVAITEEEYFKYTGKHLTYPITKKMYEHFRYMKTKIVYKDKFKCDLCTRAFPFRHELARHRLYHTGIKQHSCEICGKKFILKGQLTTHMLSHTRIRRFKCKYCPASFLLGSHLRQHLPSHNPELRLRCEICNLTFTRKASLDRHIRRIHIEKEKLLENSSKPPKRRHIYSNCYYCNRILTPKDTECLCRNKVRRDYCPFCNTRLGNAKNLSIHLETFHPNEPYPIPKSTSETTLAVSKVKKDDKKVNVTEQVQVPPLEVAKKLLHDKILGKSGINKRKPASTTQIKRKSTQETTDTNNVSGVQKTNTILAPVFNTTLVPVQLLVNPGSAPGLPQSVNQSNVILAPKVNFDGKQLLTVSGLKAIQIKAQPGHKNGTILTASTGVDGNPCLAVPAMNKIQILPNLPSMNSIKEVRVGSANGRYDVMCIEPRENDAKRKEEMDRVVTFKVETNDENQENDTLGKMVADIKVEPEDGAEADRFVVYKVTEDEPSIREGFYKALCIKQEIKEEPQDEIDYHGYTSAMLESQESNENQLRNGHGTISHNSSENGLMGNDSQPSKVVDSSESLDEVESESHVEHDYQYILDCDELADNSDLSSASAKLSQGSSSNMPTINTENASNEGSETNAVLTNADVEHSIGSNSSYTTLKSMLESRGCTVISSS